MAYALDLTASNPKNVVTSTIDRPEGDVWLFKLPGGAFFTKDLIVRNSYNNRELEPLNQFRVLDYNTDASDMSGREVCDLILITDKTINQVKITYRVIGGPFEVIGTDIDKLVRESNLDSTNTAQWGQVINKDYQFPPEMHQHYMVDVYGLEPSFYILERIAQGVTTGDGGVYGAMYQYIDRMFADLKKETAEQIETLANTANGVKDRGKFNKGQIVIFSDNSDPAVVFKYGRWKRLPDGLFMTTSNPALVGVLKKLGEGTDYLAKYYAAWEYLGD